MNSRRPHILTLFLDGIGLGEDDPETNPFAVADMPKSIELTNGKRWLADTGRQSNARAIFVPTDPRLGVPGRPQSGSGQASLLTGLNVPERIGRHYGPKPNQQTRKLIAEHSYFKRLTERGRSARLLSAYPPRLLRDFERGKTLRSSVQQAAYETGQDHFGVDDVVNRHALTSEWTTEGWKRYLKISNLPEYSAKEAGRLLARLSRAIRLRLPFSLDDRPALGTGDHSSAASLCWSDLTRSCPEFWKNGTTRKAWSSWSAITAIWKICRLDITP